MDTTSQDERVLSSRSQEKRGGLDIEPQIDFQGELRAHGDLESALKDKFSPERSKRALYFLKRYGNEEGLRWLRAEEPKIASQIGKLLRSPSPSKRK